MLHTPNSRTARASVVRMASSLWIWHTIMKNPCLRRTSISSIKCITSLHLFATSVSVAPYTSPKALN
jgi:hypothetical protein